MFAFDCERPARQLGWDMPDETKVNTMTDTIPMTRDMTRDMTRRTTLSGLGALVVAGGARPASAAENDDWMTDPRKILNTYIRMQSDVSGKVSPWRFHGYVLAVRPNEPARVLFAVEGAETKKAFVREDGYELWSKVMTMFKDPVTGDVLNGKTWQNPFTGVLNTVQPNIIGSKTLYRVSESGVILEEKSINGAPAKSVEFKMDFLVLGDKVQMEARRNPPRPWPLETMSFATNTAELAHIRDSERPRIEATFSGSDVVPWQGFMDMPGTRL